MVSELISDKRKTFMIESTGFLKYWIDDEKVSQDQKQQFTNLWLEGRIEVANKGSVSSHDQALTDLHMILNNYRAGRVQVMERILRRFVNSMKPED